MSARALAARVAAALTATLTTGLIAGLTALVVVLGAGLAAAGPAAGALRVRGDRLVDGPGRGHVVALRGVNRSGLEYACIQGWGFSDRVGGVR